MRTTLTIDPDVAQKIKRRMTEGKTSLKQVVNEALRIGLSAGHAKKPIRFKVEPHACRFKPGIDLDKLNQLADELEAEASRHSLARRAKC
jgi:hypothetical protein